MIFPPETLLSEPELRPYFALGQRLHGGFDEQGAYVPPRSLGRLQALKVWTEGLTARGGSLFAGAEAGVAPVLLPNAKQFQLLLQHGLTHPFWQFMTTNAKLEGGGRILATEQFPDLQDVIVDDISGMAIGHLCRGLLRAHGLDEGGDPDKGVGGHDTIWFMARDMVFGEGAYVDGEPSQPLRRNIASKPIIPEIDLAYETLLSYLVILFVVEIRAHARFDCALDVLKHGELFPKGASAAAQAAEWIARICIDEKTHDWSMRLYLGELQQIHFRTIDGGRLAGAEVVNRLWTQMVKWAVHIQPRFALPKQYETLQAHILAAPDGRQLLQAFNALSDYKPLPSEIAM